MISVIVRGRGVVRRAEGTAHRAPYVDGERGRSGQLWTMFMKPLDSFRDGRVKSSSSHGQGLVQLTATFSIGLA